MIPMVRRVRTFVGAVVLVLVASVAQAQTPVQHTAQMLNSCATQNATAAVNNTVTLTLTPPPGQYVYFCGWDIAISQNGTGSSATNVSWTSTNLNGWNWKMSWVGTASTTITLPFYALGQPTRSAAPGVAVTIVSPSALTNTAYNVNAYYYFAP